LKRCAKCGERKALAEFHRQPSGTGGRHAWCRLCANAYYRVNRKRNYSSEQKRRWSLQTRYGVTVKAVDAMFEAQSGQCGLCSKGLAGLRYHIDHDHHTGKVRGLLCHRCNIVIGGLDDPAFRGRAVAWLERG
jgi:Autographiviridae endonuclease VII